MSNRQLSFICVDGVTAGATPRSITVTGWASGAFERNVQIRLRDSTGTDAVVGFSTLKSVGAGYDDWLPAYFGPFSSTFAIPASMPTGAAAVVVAFIPTGSGAAPTFVDQVSLLVP